MKNNTKIMLENELKIDMTKTLLFEGFDDIVNILEEGQKDIPNDKSNALIGKIKKALFKNKLTSKEKKEAQENIKESSKNKEVKEITAILLKCENSKNLKRDLGVDGLGKHLNKNVGGILYALWSLNSILKFQTKYNTNIIPINLLASMIYFLSSLPPAILAKITSKSDMSIDKIDEIINSNSQYKALNLISYIVFNIMWILGVLYSFSNNKTLFGKYILISSLILICMSILKIMVGTIIGYTSNNWKLYHKLFIKYKKDEYHTENTIQDQIDTLVFLSSIRESISDKVSTNESKKYIMFEMSDYDLLHYVIEGKFNNVGDKNYSGLLEYLNMLMDSNFVFVENINTICCSTRIIIEKLNNFYKNNTNILLESANQEKLDELEKLMKAAKKEFVKLYAKEKQSGTNSDATKYASAKFTDAKNRYNKFKDTGVDIGSGSYSKGFSKRSNQNQSSSNNSRTNQRSNQNQSSSNQSYNKYKQNWSNFKSGMKNKFENIYGSEKLSKILKTDKKTSSAIIAGGSILLSALIIYSGYKLYQNKFSEKSKACKKYKGIQFKKCMVQKDLESIDIQIKDLKSSVNMCDMLDNESMINSCKLSLKGKVRSIKKQRSKLKTKLRKL